MVVHPAIMIGYWRSAEAPGKVVLVTNVTVSECGGMGCRVLIVAYMIIYQACECSITQMVEFIEGRSCPGEVRVL